jgi:thioredoxin-related protein
MAPHLPRTRHALLGLALPLALLGSAPPAAAHALAPETPVAPPTRRITTADTGTAAANLLFGRHARDLQAESLAARQAGKQLAVLFEQADCPACAALRHKVLATARVRAIDRSWRTVVLRTDEATAIRTPGGESLPPGAFAARLRVPGTPAIAVFGDEGQLVYRHVGPLHDGRDLELLTRFVREARFEELPFTAYRRAHRPAAPMPDHGGHG